MLKQIRNSGRKERIRKKYPDISPFYEVQYKSMNSAKLVPNFRNMISPREGRNRMYDSSMSIKPNNRFFNVQEEEMYCSSVNHENKLRAKDCIIKPRVQCMTNMKQQEPRFKNLNDSQLSWESTKMFSVPSFVSLFEGNIKIAKLYDSNYLNKKVKEMQSKA